MGRPALRLGTHGKISSVACASGFEARTMYRDLDGVTRKVRKSGKTRGSAEQALQEVLKSRYSTQGDITGDTKLKDLAEMWWSEVALERYDNPSTRELYRDVLDKKVLPGLGDLRVRELRVGLIDRHLRTIAAKHGHGTARTAKSVLSNLCKMAVKNDALQVNPVRGVELPPAPIKEPPRAFTAEETREFVARLRADLLARERDIVDLLLIMLATGLRMGEACAIQFRHIDFGAGTIQVGVGVVKYFPDAREWRVYRNPRSPKQSERVLELPTWALSLLRARRARIEGDVAFPQPRAGGFRDQHNTRKHVKAAFKAAGQEDATSHILRKTVVSVMHEAGLSPRLTSDQVGHARVTLAQDTYVGRTRTVTGSKYVLEALVSALS